jgi:hypothetical protein
MAQDGIQRIFNVPPSSESIMRYLLLIAFVLTACERRDTARDDQPADTMPSPAPGETMTPVGDRLIGTWNARGVDVGGKSPQQFTMTWERAPDGGLVGRIAFQPGESYTVKVVSTTDSTIVYESEPHQSPTLKAQVVTRSEARLVGDSLSGTYEARAQTGGKVLRGKFTAVRR